MGKFKRYLLVACCLLSTLGILLARSTPATPSSRGVAIAQNPALNVNNTAPLIEEFTFLIKDFKISHQSEINNLNITVRYRYIANIPDAAYPDFRLTAKDIENLLTNYPNKKDYWEIINKKITMMVLEKYPAIASVTSEIQVSPSPLVPDLRSSIVTRNRSSHVRLGSKKNAQRK